jgi:ubiquinone/menaquinone biosynthesis C-methylase UbiE
LEQRERKAAPHRDPEVGMATLSREEARSFYDGFGAKQDTQWFYEAPAVEDLIAHASFEEANAVFELGCGTGHTAEILLGKHLPSSATYEACDLSTTMVTLAQQRLAKFGARVQVRATDGSTQLPAPGARFDRFLSTYVLDLMAEADISTLLQEAHRVLKPGGRLCLVSLTFGATALSRSVIWVWQRVHALRPQLVGGCRPIELTDFLSDRQWQVVHRKVVVSYGIPSEIVVAEKRA